MGLKKVANTYSDVGQYLDTFEPLLFEEVKAQIVSGKDEDEGMFFLNLLVSHFVNFGVFLFRLTNL